MKYSRGFTLIELIIVMVVMAVLMALGVVGLNTTQKQARDKERSADIEIIQRSLEQYYERGDVSVSTPTKGTYPSTTQFDGFISAGTQYEILPSLNQAALTPPSKSVISLESSSGTTEASPVAIVNPGITTKLNAGKYVYKPMTSTSEASCSSSCSRYALLYKEEQSGTVKIILSQRK